MRPCDNCGDQMSENQLVNLMDKWICAKCKPNFLMDLKSGVSLDRGSISPEEAQRIRSRIRGLNLLSFAFALPGFALQFGGGALGGGRHGEGVSPLAGLGGLLIIIGLCLYARMKGRSWAWGLFGLLSCIGLLILYFLGPVCRNCGKTESYRSKACGRCGAPVAP